MHTRPLALAALGAARRLDLRDQRLWERGGGRFEHRREYRHRVDLLFVVEIWRYRS